MSAETKVKTRPPDDIAEALDRLSHSEKARIQSAAMSFSRVMGISWEDLFSEAVARTLEGRRNCPEHVHPVAFIINVMKSLKSDDFRALKRRKAEGFEIISQGDLIDEKANDSAQSPEDLMITRENDEQWIQSYETFLDAFEGDDDIQYILIAMQQGFEGKAIREQAGLDETTYSSARRRMRRNLPSGNLNGLKP